MFPDHCLHLRIGDGRKSSVLTIFLYFESSKTHTSHTNTHKIFMDIFVPVVVKKNHPMQEKQRNTFRGLNVKIFQMQTGFVHIAAKKLDDVA